MRVLLTLFSFACLTLSTSAAAQDTPPRDPRAIAVLQQSLAAMGGTVPADSVATGTVVLVEGSATKTGTMRILTRGLDQTAEYIQLTTGNHRYAWSTNTYGYDAWTPFGGNTVLLNPSRIGPQGDLASLLIHESFHTQSAPGGPRTDVELARAAGVPVSGDPNNRAVQRRASRNFQAELNKNCGEKK